MQAGCGIVGRNRQGLVQQHVARVQPGIHLHDGDAGLAVARLNGAVDGGCATPAGQQRGVDVDAAQPRQVQHPLRQQQAVGGHDHDVGLRSKQGSACSLGILWVFAIQPQAAGLGHGQAMRQCSLLDGRSLQLQAAAGGAIGLGQNQWHGIARLHDVQQGLLGKLRRSGKNNAHDEKAKGLALAERSKKGC